MANEKRASPGTLRFETFAEDEMAALMQSWKKLQATQMPLDFHDSMLEDAVSGRRPPR